MTDFALGDTVCYTVWSDRNCGPLFAWEYGATVVDSDYQPTDEDRAADEDGYLRSGQRYVLVDRHSGWQPYMIVAADELRTEPTPATRPTT